MQTFFKVQVTSLLASAVDFLTTIVGVHLLNSWFMAASLIGSVCGGLVNFVVAKTWTFPLNNQPLGPQFGRFFLVWLGNAGINAAGLFAATHVLGVQYLLAKTTVSILVGISYNYFFQKDFVFSVS
ncbi:GtrA family protein [Spirosoma agri]|uniref:GtrA family protein n=1 Tax=Spirosoma agri TaxID=1987381 RepID=A0A6M0IRS2_9BACT|nr:GtrA family protein [Spirosoma agri]NEU70702.1 GtrA family protein [Spirosoma agri]